MTRFVGTPLRGVEFSSPSDEAFSTRVLNDSNARLRIDAGGRLTWSSGSVTGDVNLYRYDINVLKTDDAFQAAGGLTTITTNGIPSASSPDGTIAVDTTNNVFYFRSGAEWLEVSSGANVVISSTAPVNAESGDLWFNSDTLVLYILNGATWVSVSGSLTLAELDDVTITQPQAGEFLAYNGVAWVNSLGGNSKYAVQAVIGDGIAQQFTLTHNFGTRDVLVVARSNSSPYESIEVIWEATTENTVLVSFSSPPDEDDVRINILYTGATTSLGTYSTTIGDGIATDFTISHNLNTRDVFISVRETSSPYAVIDVNWEATTVDSATIYISEAPTSNSLRVTVFSAASVFGSTSPVLGNLDDLGDVTLSNLQQNQVLAYNGSQWVNSSSMGGGGINIDGGTASSTYGAGLLIDGGGASG